MIYQSYYCQWQECYNKVELKFDVYVSGFHINVWTCEDHAHHVLELDPEAELVWQLKKKQQ